MSDSHLIGSIDATLWLKARQDASVNFDDVRSIIEPVSTELDARLDLLGFNPERIVLIGAWDGFLARKIATRYPQGHISLLEMSDGFTAKARSNLKKFNNINYLKVDDLPLPCPTDSVDLVLSDLSLPPFWPLETFFAECRRIMVPKGYLSLALLGERSFLELREACETGSRRKHIHDFIDIQSLGMGLVSAGFADPVVDRESLAVSYGSLTSIRRDLKNLGAINCRKDRFRGCFPKAIATDWPQRLFGNQERVTLRAEVLYAQAFAPTGLPPKRVSRVEQVLPFPVR